MKLKSLLLAATMLGALAASANAQTSILTPADEDRSGTGTFDGQINSQPITGLNTTITYTLLDVNAATDVWTFGYNITNTSGGNVTASRISSFGFNTSPDLIGATFISGDVFTQLIADPSGNVGEAGPVDLCIAANAGCSGGDGLVIGQADTGSFSLTFGSSVDQLALSNFFVRYQSIQLNGQGDFSGVGFPGPNGVPFGVTPVPGPAIGAGLPGLLAVLGFGGWVYRRRRTNP
jgi:hypothetical protein